MNLIRAALIPTMNQTFGCFDHRSPIYQKIIMKPRNPYESYTTPQKSRRNSIHNSAKAVKSTTKICKLYNNHDNHKKCPRMLNVSWVSTQSPRRHLETLSTSSTLIMWSMEPKKSHPSWLENKKRITTIYVSYRMARSHTRTSCALKPLPVAAPRCSPGKCSRRTFFLSNQMDLLHRQNTLTTTCGYRRRILSGA